MWWLHFSKWSTSHSSVAIFQMCQRVGFTSHKSYLILGFVFNTMIFWTVQLLTEKLPNKGYDAPRMKSSKPKFKCHHHQLVGRYEIYISQMAIDFPPYMFFLSSITEKTLAYLIIRVIGWVSYQKHELFTLHEHLCSPPDIWWGLCCSAF